MEHRDGRLGIGVEGHEGVVQRLRMVAVDSVAYLGPVERHQRHRPVAGDPDRHQDSPSGCAGSISKLSNSTLWACQVFQCSVR